MSFWVNSVQHPVLESFVTHISSESSALEPFGWRSHTYLISCASKPSVSVHTSIERTWASTGARSSSPEAFGICSIAQPLSHLRLNVPIGLVKHVWTKQPDGKDTWMHPLRSIFGVPSFADSLHGNATRNDFLHGRCSLFELPQVPGGLPRN